MSRLSIVLGLQLLGVLQAGPLLAQGCTQLPAATNEFWMGLEAEGGAPATAFAAQFSFNLLDRGYLSGGFGAGGFDTGAGAASTQRLGVGIMERIGGISICPGVVAGLARYTFRRRFDVYQGEVREGRLGPRIALAGRVVEGRSIAVRWLATGDFTYRRWSMAGRTLSVAPSWLEPEIRNEDSGSWELEGSLGAELRFGSVAVLVGVGTERYERRELTRFIRLSTRIN